MLASPWTGTVTATMKQRTRRTNPAMTAFYPLAHGANGSVVRRGGGTDPRYARPEMPSLRPPGTKTAFDVQKELDEVVGRYEEGRGERALRRYGRWFARFVAAAVLASATAAAVMYVLHDHVMQAQKAPAPKKPVSVRIVPAQK